MKALKVSDFIFLSNKTAPIYELKQIDTNETFLAKLYEFSLPHFTSQVIEEYRHLFTLKHSNIISLIGFIEKINQNNNNFQIYVIFEKMNENLIDYLKKRKKGKFYLSKVEMKNFVSNVYQAIEFLRKKKLAHKNLKMTNILISNNCFKLSDMELFKFRNSLIPLKYLPYKQVDNLNSFDYYAFGVMIVEVATLEIIDDDQNLLHFDNVTKTMKFEELRIKYGVELENLVNSCLEGEFDSHHFERIEKEFKNYLVRLNSFVILKMIFKKYSNEEKIDEHIIGINDFSFKIIFNNLLDLIFKKLKEMNKGFKEHFDAFADPFRYSNKVIIFILILIKA